VLSGAAAVTTPSAYLRERMKDYRPDLELVPNALDLSAYRFRLRRQARPRLVWIRSFHEIYNPALAPRALAAVEDASARLTMIGRDTGDGSLAKVRRIAALPALAGRVELKGSVAKTEVPAWLDRSDIFVNTANVDNTPVTVLEAMACGLCVVSTNVGGIPYLLEDGRNALLVPPDDPPAMAAAIERILREPELARRLSDNGRETVERFDWPGILPRWETLLHAVGAGAA
jgi:glycosyltransferase involved in cell wall biosynthesis